MSKTINKTFGIAVHGGAGAIPRSEMKPEVEHLYHAVLKEALMAGYAILANKGSSIDAVQQAITVLEDAPQFNAGKGAVFTSAGENELDAALMEGKNLQAGMVAGVKRIKNPILLARWIMDRSPHVMLVGDGAEQFAQEQGFELMPASYFYTERQWQKLQRAKQREQSGHSGEISEDEKHGTVGAVALDRFGNLAAGTSTGGMTNKRVGRVGDSPILGAGTYANNASCAISATGYGEYIMRLVAGYDIHSLMAYRKMSLRAAAESVVLNKLTELGGTGGVVAIDKQGNIAMPFNTEGMYRGYIVDENLFTGIY